jgi:Flp pilus assembly protein TadG
MTAFETPESPPQSHNRGNVCRSGVMLIASLKVFSRDLWDDTRGLMLPYVTTMLVVIVGVSVLAVDGARMVSLQTQLQQAADALALAGAAELDQRSTSITRASNAIASIVTNKTLPGIGNANVTLSSIRFLKSLPAGDSSPIAVADTTLNPIEARYVEVTVQPITLATVLPASFFGGSNSVTAGAQAVAGRGTEVVCKVPPVFICNPYELPGMSDSEATELLLAKLSVPLERRRQWKLKASKTGPGQFGWLVPPDGCTGASCLTDWIARTTPNACYRKSGVDLNTGEKTSVKDGFNIRFDIYQGSIKYSADYAPGINVRKGYHTSQTGKWCPPKAGPVNPYYSDATVTALPRDSAFTDFMGNGQWDCQRYWTLNHTANLPTVLPDGQTAVCGSTATTTWSRYNVYRYEIAQGLINDWSGSGHAPNGNGESGEPLCAGAGSGVDETTGKTDRRLIIVPIINCLANGPFPPGFNATDVPVAAFGNFFMTQPVDGSVESDPGNPLYGELTGQTTAANADIYVPVQLYR